ncbi:DNA gyrase inhibitor YacG [Pseudoruegeria sp. SK021]|uniref:DNA gyrase inhibitor YacG n=1 Tax=Pseudoruegeria sp. SK021 TaxID=1933035 RepID=UPI000A22C64D|nr:DNA gyrase inhibitor YacG [Pseudoruegeria sp. SK021]OSP54063.1 DNA gyrase inhibitor YacG [Pseudoruegeria sp. SK021]
MTCPICARPANATYRPFCSKRCADVDLGQWLTGGYAIPIPEDDESAEDHDPLQDNPFQSH